MKKISSKIIHFWNEDKSLSVMMLLLFLFIFVFVPTLSVGRAGEVFIKIVYSVMLLTGVLSVRKDRKYVSAVAVFAVLSLSLNWLSNVYPIPSILIAEDVCAILFNLFFATIMLIKTFAPGDITFHRIEGSIVVYLLLGMVFAFAFHAIYLVNGSKSFNNLNSDNGMKDFLYFSFTSLTTMGYGDITPVHPFARSMANFEALIGQLYPAILIARLVTMEFDSSSKKRAKNQ